MRIDERQLKCDFEVCGPGFEPDSQVEDNKKYSCVP